MQYLTYEEYKTIGGKLDLTAFELKITRVCAIVTNATYGRIEALRDIPKEVKELCRDLIEYLSTVEQNTNIKSKGQSAGGVSESITYSEKEEQNKYINDLMYEYLASVTTKNGTSLLYRGCSC